jgi:NAD(P)-dependent dehydrogenase (short-subunit alcohol dehydrogenase family)
MLLQDKNAVIYGGGGAIGGAVARAFAREGARVFFAGRTLAKLNHVARDFSAAGGMAETAEVDALDEHAIDMHADAVAAKAGGIDIALNAVGIRVICLRPDAIPEAVATSHAREVFSGFAERVGTTVENMLAERACTGTLLKRFPTLAEVADFAAFVASDRAIANLTCGSLVD